MLDFTFTEEQEMFKEALRDFCDKNIVPKLKDMYAKKQITRELVKKMADFELLAPTADEAYGGINMDAVTAGIVAEELGRADPSCSIPVFYLVQASWGYFVNKYGTEELKQEVFPKVTKGEHFLGIATTESDVGSDLGNMKTQIRGSENGYIVNGEKNYISGVKEVKDYGGGYVLLAKQTTELGIKGMTCCYFPLNVGNVTTVIEEEIGREAISMGGFTINNVQIPKYYLIGEENKGFYIIHEGYEYARGLIALVCVGCAIKALENGMDYIKTRKAFGYPLAKYEAIQFALAENYTKLEAGRLLAYKALWMFDREREGKAKRFEVAKSIAMAKMLTPEWCYHAVDDVMQWQGAYGYTIDCLDTYAWRGLRSFTLAEGSKEIMKIIVARELLGKEYIPYKK